MAESARSTAAQMLASDHVAEQMAAVRDAVERIRAATREQAQGQDRVRHSSAELHQVARAVQHTVDEQTLGASRIGASIETVQRAVGEITKGLEEQAAASHQVAEVMRSTRESGRSHRDSSARMDEAGRELEREAEALRSAVRRFRIEPGEPGPGYSEGTRSTPS
jgi:methyl-accepting chemotaxis protein